ncbi:MAG TPA: hypothetical protein VM661_05320 [Candidatus Sulfotelmatobacter sp.]|jgi:fumarate reductase subunit C|nr:hypothetical protein [Candidatus Sulfotelmatobacter sp.]
MSRRPYLRTVERNWWLSRRRYVVYMIREVTCLFIALYSALLTDGLVRLAEGQAAWDSYLTAISSPPGVLFQLVCLVFATIHSVTWFGVTPKAMPLMIKGEPVPPQTIIRAHYALWAAASLVVLIAAGV